MKRASEPPVGGPSGPCWAPGCRPTPPAPPLPTWRALGSQPGQAASGKALGLLNTIDEPTRACLDIVAGCSVNADKVVATLDELAAKKGAPKYLRTGNGPELVAYALADWCWPAGTGSTFTGPGCPWLGAWVESFNGRPQDELLSCHQFSSLLEARVLLEDWWDGYNYDRPNRALGMLAPGELAAAWYDKFNQPALA